MRTYVGDRPETGPTRVRIIEEPDKPALTEINEVLAELNHITFNREDTAEFQARRDRYLARKDDLVRRMRAAEARPESRPLPKVHGSSPDGFEWGYVGNGPGDLAAAILRNELAVEPTDKVRHAFCRDVVARLPRAHFTLPASDVAAWVKANRALVDREQFLKPETRPPAVTTSVDRGHKGPGLSAETPSPSGTSLVDDGLDGPDVAAEMPSHAVAGSVDGEPGALATGVGAAEPGEATASALVAACEAAWDDIRSHHPELPDAVVILGTGVERGRLVKLGHWWGGRWVADGQTRGEVLIAGEALHLPPREVFEVLLHEAAHGINASRKVRDTSRNGRYHNQQFADTAREVLLHATAMPPYGIAGTSLTPAAELRYGPTIDRLGEAMRIARQLDKTSTAETSGETGAGTGGDHNGTRKSQAAGASCGCGRRIRMAPSVLAAGPVVCGLCGSEFSTGAEPRSVDAARAKEGQRPDRLEPGLVREISRQHDRLDGAVQTAAAQSNQALSALLAERRDRLARLLDRIPPPTDPDPRIPVDPDHAAVSAWYEHYGTHGEHVLPADDPFQRARRRNLARDLLKADGTLNGPAVTIGRTELMAGDRVIATADDPRSGLPAGVPGTITAVNPALHTIDLDFDTWGTLRTSTGGPVARSLRHAYTELDTTPPLLSDRSPASVELEHPGPDIEP